MYCTERMVTLRQPLGTSVARAQRCTGGAGKKDMGTLQVRMRSGARGGAGYTSGCVEVAPRSTGLWRPMDSATVPCLSPNDAAAGRLSPAKKVVASSSGEVGDKVGEHGRQAATTQARESPLCSDGASSVLSRCESRHYQTDTKARKHCKTYSIATQTSFAPGRRAVDY